jgi:hypothetical protein
MAEEGRGEVEYVTLSDDVRRRLRDFTNEFATRF